MKRENYRPGIKFEKWVRSEYSQIKSGQISDCRCDRFSTTDFPQKVAFRKGNPRKNQGNLGWWNIIISIIWPEKTLFPTILEMENDPFGI